LPLRAHQPSTDQSKDERRGMSREWPNRATRRSPR
jgi:hypothetical protein